MKSNAKIARFSALPGWYVATLVLVCNGVLGMFPSESFAASGRAPVRIIAFGDSLTAGYLLRPSQSLPVQLEQALRAKGHNVTVINAGVSGDTTAAGLERFDWATAEPADAVILELGGNDALRGIDPAETRKNLDTLITRLKAKGLAVLLAGMQSPANWGEGYKDQFDAIYPELAAKHGVVFYPFLLEGVALERRFALDDGIHPNAAGVAEIVKRMLPTVEKLLASVHGPARAAN